MRPIKLLSPRVFAIGLLYLVLSAFFCAPLFSQPTALGIGDWDKHLFYYAQVLKTIVEYGQPPFWSPWYCGGNVMWQNPQVALISPVYVLTAFLPLALAMKVNIVIHYWIGFVGMHLLLTRVAGVRFLPLVVYLASMFTFSGAVALHLAVGHSVYLTAFYLPFLTFFVLKAFETGSLRAAFSAAGIVAVTVFNGGMHVVPIELLAVATCAFSVAVTQRNLRALLIAGVVSTCAAMYAAPKLGPVTAFVTSDRFWDTRPPIQQPDRMTPAMIWRAYTDASQSRESRVDRVQRHGWWEYGNFIGTTAITLIAVSLVSAFIVPSLSRRWLAQAMAVTALLFLLLSAGEFHPFAPAVALRQVPLLSSFRIPSRYTIGFVFFGTLTVAVVAGPILNRLVGTGRRRLLMGTACAVALLQIAVVNRAHFRNTFADPPLEGRFRILQGRETLVRDTESSVRGSSSPMLRAVMRNMPLFACYESLQIMRSADPDRPLLWTAGDAKISAVAFTPNRVRFSVTGGHRPADVFLNQNYAPGWRSTAGRLAVDLRGHRMFVRLSPGQTGRFEFSFVPPGLVPGLVLCLIALAGTYVNWRKRLAPPVVGRSDVDRRPEPVAFGARAERATKIAVMLSLGAAIAGRVLLHADGATTFGALVGATIAFGWLMSRASAYVIGVPMALAYVAPALVAYVWAPTVPAYPTIWVAGIFATILPRMSWRRWSLPPAWRVPLVFWVFVFATSWPILALREVDFHPEVVGVLDQPASMLAFSARASIIGTLDAATFMMLGILWLDWLFEAYALDQSAFRRAVVVPLHVSCAVSCAVAAYQLTRDATFLNRGGIDRMGGTMIDANAFGVVAVLCGTGFIVLLDRARPAWNALIAAGFGLALVGMWASGSKTAFAAQLIVWSFMLASFARAVPARLAVMSRRRLVVVISVLTIAAAVYVLRQTGPALRLGLIVPAASLESPRAFVKEVMWNRYGYGRAAVQMIQKSPWFGVGVGSFQTIVGDYPYSHMQSPLTPDHAQNWVRHQLAELGLVGSLGWMAWSLVLGVGFCRQWRTKPTPRRLILGGALISVIAISQVGMPTQNPAIAMTFWTFLFWYFAHLSGSESATRSSEKPIPAWQWAAMIVVLIVFIVGTIATSLTKNRVSMRARDGEWDYRYGFTAPALIASGEEFRWAQQNAVVVFAAPPGTAKITIWVGRATPATRPVAAQVWHNDRLLIDTVLRDSKPVSAYARVDQEQRWMMVRTYVDRALPPDPSDEGLAVQLTFVDQQ
jgi:O-antigen ligase